MGATVSELVYQALPESAATEQLHEARKLAVGHEACAAFVRELRLDELLAVGPGYEGAEPTCHMLAEAFEAIWGALYVDAGFKLELVRGAYARCCPINVTAAVG